MSDRRARVALRAVTWTAVRSAVTTSVIGSLVPIVQHPLFCPGVARRRGKHQRHELLNWQVVGGGVVAGGVALGAEALAVCFNGLMKLHQTGGLIDKN